MDLADISAAPRTITFDPTAFAAAQTITLRAGQLQLEPTSGVIAIDGPAAALTVSGGHASGVFRIASNVTATLTGLTITGGSTTGSGGGLANQGTAMLQGCTIGGNTAAYGGGLWTDASATLTDCTVSGNSASESGAGVWNYGSATLIGCTVSGNTAATLGGGVFNYAGTATLTGCTVSGNTATGGGGLDGRTGRAMLEDTIVAGNIGPGGASDIAGVGVTGKYSLIGPGGSGGIAGGSDGDIVLASLDAIDLAPLANNGGPTRTMALLPGSAAINAGNNALDADSDGVILPSDQRGTGFPRVVGGTADIGAYEYPFLTTRISLSAPGGATSTFGQMVTFTATVVVIDGGTGVLAGSVEFFDGRTPLGSVALDGSGRASLTTSALGLGPRSITATYSGNAQSTASAAGAVSVSVIQDGSQVVLVPHAVLKKKKVVALDLVATIEPLAPGGGVPTGSVTFEVKQKKKVKVLGTAPLVVGEATLAVKPKGVLKKSITIVYGGDPDFRASAVSVTLSSRSLTTRVRPMAFGRAGRPALRWLAGEAPAAKRDGDRLMPLHEPDSSRTAAAWRHRSSTSPAEPRRRARGPRSSPRRKGRHELRHDAGRTE